MKIDHGVTMERLRNPSVGDRFHEMYSFWMYVVAVDALKITIIEASAPCSFPIDGKKSTMSREDFVRKFSYKNIPGAWVTFCDSDNNVEGWL